MGGYSHNCDWCSVLHLQSSTANVNGMSNLVLGAQEVSSCGKPEGYFINMHQRGHRQDVKIVVCCVGGLHESTYCSKVHSVVGACGKQSGYCIITIQCVRVSLEISCRFEDRV